MESLDLARAQFAITTVYHFFFVPLTLGLSIFVAILQTIYVRTGDEHYKKMTKFWGKLFVINFAMGVVTGLVQEFQFGMNWSEYSRFVGDIFGAPLAIEALMAFFIESTFLGMWIFGWERLSKRVHLASIWLVAFASNLSAFWILVANSFMQHPVGYTLADGRAEMTDFFALVTNSYVWKQFPHVVFAGVATAGFFVLGISAYHLLRKHPDQEFFHRSFRLAVVYAVLGAWIVMLAGHSQMQYMVETQPMKVAAAEALWETEDPASLSLFTIGDTANRKDVFSIRIPYLLTILSYNRLDGAVQGINQLQAQYEKTYGAGDYVPPVFITYWSFRLMVGAGTLMGFASLYGLYLILKKKLENAHRFLWWLIPGISLPYLANTSGWFLTEFGRQPWIVHGLQRTEEAVSPNVSTGMVLITLVGFTLIYAVLMVANVYLLWKFGKAGPEDPVEATPIPDVQPAASF